MSEYTKGPWVIVELAHKNLVTAGGSTIAEVYGEGIFPEVTPEVEANALLIAAAPDLLEALRAAEKIIVNAGLRPVCHKEWEQINAALTRATQGAV